MSAFLFFFCGGAAPGDILTTQDVTQKRLYLVMDGDLEVAKHGTQIATVGAGEFTGEVNFWRHGLVSLVGQLLERSNRIV